MTAAVLAGCDAAAYLAVRKVICPYCAVPIPDTHDNGSPPKWTHSIAGTGQTFSCLANSLRVQRLADGSGDA